MLRVDPSSIDLDILDINAEANIELAEESADSVDSAESKGVVGKEWTAVGVMINSATCLK